MRVENKVFRAPRVEEKRRGVRLNSRVPVIIEWQNASGVSFREKAFTRTVGPYGCLVVLPQNLSVQQRVRIVNTSTGHANAGIVKWKGNEHADSWEIGIELSQPPMDFWGLEL